MTNKTRIEDYGTSRFDALVPPHIVNQVIEEIYKSGDLNKLNDRSYIKARIDKKMSLTIHGIMTTFDSEQNKKMLESLNDDLRKKHDLDFKVDKDIFKQYIVKTPTENRNDFVKFLYEFNFEKFINSHKKQTL